MPYVDQFDKPIEISPVHFLEVLKPVNIVFTDFLDFQSLCLLNLNRCYEICVAQRIGKMAKLMQVPMRHDMFYLDSPISVLSLLSTLKTTSNRNAVSEGAVMKLVPFLIRNAAALIITARARLHEWSKKSIQGVLYSYCDVVNCLLPTEAT